MLESRLNIFRIMKVVLKVDVKSLGRKGEIVDVADGYATSALIPSGKAVVATPGAIKQSEKSIAAKAAGEKQIQEKARENAQMIKGGVIEISGKADGGKLFGSIGSAEVAQEIQKQYNVNIEEKGIDISHLKEIGDHEVVIDLGYGHDAKIIVRISAIEG